MLIFTRKVHAWGGHPKQYEPADSNHVRLLDNIYIRFLMGSQNGAQQNKRLSSLLNADKLEVSFQKAKTMAIVLLMF